MIARSALGKILVFSVFFIGIGTGALLDTAYRTRVSRAGNDGDRRGGEHGLSPQERAKRDLDRMGQYLGLDQNQKEQIAKIQDETRGEFRALREKTDPEFKALREKVDPQFKAIEERSRARIGAILNAEQRRKWEEVRAQRQNNGRGRPGPRSGDRTDKSNRPDKQ